MKFYQLDYLDDSAKAEEMVRAGVLLLERLAYEYKYLLYQLHGFYIEVLYNLHTNKIETIRSFNCTSLLEPYLATMDISQLDL